jgi:hypothetical protein
VGSPLFHVQLCFYNPTTHVRIFTEIYLNWYFIRSFFLTPKAPEINCLLLSPSPSHTSYSCGFHKDPPSFASWEKTLSWQYLWNLSQREQTSPAWPEKVVPVISLPNMTACLQCKYPLHGQPGGTLSTSKQYPI